MVEVGAATHPGRVRSNNEDYFLHGPTPHGYVAIVCDGMGGHEAGEVAARLAAEAVMEYLNQTPSTEDLEGLLRDAVLAANHRIILHTQSAPLPKAPGSTIVVALFTDTHVVYAHVGDSRLYAFVDADLIPLTQDDSLVHQMLSSGLITAEQALHHPQKNVLTQSLGQQPPPTPHVARTPLKKGAAYLLCTDGLFGALSREEIITILLRQDLPSPQAKVEALIEQANQNGGYDNITAIFIQPLAKSSTFVGRMNLKLPPQKYLIGGGIAIIVIAILVGIFMRRSAKSTTSGSGEIIIVDDTSALNNVSSMSPPPPPTEEEMPSPSPVLANPPSEAPSPSETPAPSQSSKATANASATAKTDKASEKKTTFDYTVKKGDNLGKIAEVFGVSVTDLRRVNGLKDDKIQEGKKLKIPVKAVHYHIVKEKETLSAIARKYGTGVEVIKRANNTDEKIRPGQKLIIPVVGKK